MMKKIFGNRFTSYIGTVIVTFLLGLGLNYFLLVPINFRASGFWWFTLVMLMVATGIALIFHTIYRRVNGEYDDPYHYRRTSDEKKSKRLLKKLTPPVIFAGIAIIWIIVMFLTSISGWKLGNSDEYANIVTVEEGNFAEDVADASENQENIVYVDQKTAQKLGDRTLGTVTNPSWYEVDDEYNLVCINGEYYRISPVDYASFWSSGKVRDKGGIPGYVSVNVKTQDAEFVYFNEGEGMIYSPSGCFGYDLDRHIHNAYPSEILGKSFFEVDDNNHPYWITEMKTPSIGVRGGVIVNKFVITDASTGEMQVYAPEDLPEWVDHAYSVGYLMEVIGWHYQYANGFWNFSKTNLYKTTYSYKSSISSEEENEYTPFDGYNTAIGKNGEIIFYTGITPDNKAETNIGFVSVSPRTGEVTFYSVTGAEESSAQIAAEGLVSNLKYSASFPILINVEGVETYFMVLKDQGGLVQRYALCNIKNYAKCVEAESIEEAIVKYKMEIGLTAADESDNDTDTANPESEKLPESSVETTTTIEVSGTITEVTEAQIDGYTFYYFTMEGETLVFMSSIENSNMQPMKLKVGTSVTIKYYESIKESGIGIVEEIVFD